MHAVFPGEPIHDAVHAEDGIFILYNPGERQGKELSASIYDIAPSILQLMGIEVPEDMDGKSILTNRNLTFLHSL